ncbi:MAG TPA: thioredoxin family protein [Thermoleophilaceae bacterium]|nr:thioredoxin family protein [Thermoleophilaceae bacterium]
MRRLLFVMLMLMLTLAACGGDDSDDGAEAPPPPAKAADFPKGGQSVAALRKEASGAGPVLAPTQSQLTPGQNRYGFALFDRARAQIADVPVALYVAPAGGKTSGPVVAKWESLKVPAQFQSQSTADDPDAAKAIYAAQLKFPKAGRYQVVAVAKLDGRLVSSAVQADVTANGKVPAVGDPAPKIDTPTVASAGGDVKKIDTRLPPSSLHAENFRDVVGKKPVVLLFATPALCQTRVCGPVVDVAEQVKAKRGKDVEFIQMEIFNDNQVDKGYRPQVRAYNLPTEPWVFAIDKNGKVAARIEGPYSAAELERAVDAATK